VVLREQQIPRAKNKALGMTTFTFGRTNLDVRNEKMSEAVVTFVIAWGRYRIAAAGAHS
jgi:hypothetical protein